MKRLTGTICLLAVFSVVVNQTSAQILWEEDGVPLRKDHCVQWGGWTAENASGDVYVVWNESRDLSEKIYGQKYDSRGVRLWPEDIILIDLNAMMLDICPTPDDGLVIAWVDGDQSLGPIIKAQKIDTDGNMLWEPGGVFVGALLLESSDRNRDGSYSDFNLVSDGEGGIFVTWVDEIRPNQIDLYAKRLLADGSLAPGWEPRGNIIKDDVDYSGSAWSSKFTCTDDANGFMVAWEWYFGYSLHGSFVQHVDGEGNLLWGENGLQLARDSGLPRLERDGSGGIFCVWAESRYSPEGDLFMQRLDNEGNALWQEYGIPLVTAPELQFNPQMINDGFGGAIVAWDDHRNSTFYEDAYCQRVSGEGELLWSSQGVALSNGWEYYTKIDSDGAGGLFAAWMNWENYGYSHKESYIQRVTADGHLAWQTAGILLTGGEEDEVNAAVPVGTDDGGALFFWSELHDDLVGIYLQKTDENGVFQFPPGGETVAEGMAGAVDLKDLAALSSDRFISVWEDSRWNVGLGDRLYYQVFDSDANILLEEDGAPLCPETQGEQRYPVIASTSGGDAIIAWRDNRSTGSSYRIYVQKVDWQGNLQWSPDGVRASLAEEGQDDQFACSDGMDGGYVLWRIYPELYIQRLDADGNRLFGSVGLRITNSPESNIPLALVPDGQGGAIVIYGIYSEAPVFAARILPAGIIDWTVQVYDLATDPDKLVAVQSQDGGAVVAWEDHRNGFCSDIYAQKIDNSGAMIWTANGVPVGINNSSHYQYPQIVENVGGFVYVGWRISGYDLYCQRLTPDGVCQFPLEGLVICDARDDQTGLQMVADGFGGAIFMWGDNRGMFIGSYMDLYAIHLDSHGSIADPFWIRNGNPLCRYPGSQYYADIISDGYGGAVITWLDGRGHYMQRVNDFIVSDEIQTVPAQTGNCLLLQNRPNPFNPATTISFSLPEASKVNLSIYDISGRLVTTLVDGFRDAGINQVTFDASHLASGIYVYRLEMGTFTANGKMIVMK